MSRSAHLAALVFAVITLAASGAASAQQPPARLNYEYYTIPPQPVRPGAQIEVIEFFWYGCPYCAQLQAPLVGWLKRKPQDVEFRRIPAVFRESWVPHARLFYTLESLGEVERLHQEVYQSYHLDRNNLNSAEATADWAAKHGIDRAKWLSVFNSPEIDAKVEQSKAATRSYVIKGTPSVVVDGRYVTSSGMSESVPGVVGIVDDLIRIARERRTAK